MRRLAISTSVVLMLSSIACGGAPNSDPGSPVDGDQAELASTRFVPAMFHCDSPESGTFDVRTMTGPSISVSSNGQTATAKLDSHRHAELGQFLSEEPNESFAVTLDTKMFAGKNGAMDLIFRAEEGTSHTKYTCESR